MTDITLSNQAYMNQISSQAGLIANLQLIQGELMLQIEAKDAQIAELRKAKGTKRTTAKKKPSA